MRVSRYIDPLYRTLVGLLFIIIGSSIIAVQHNNTQTDIGVLGPICLVIGFWLLYTGGKKLIDAINKSKK